MASRGTDPIIGFHFGEVGEGLMLLGLLGL